MHLIPLSAILVGEERQRRAFAPDALNELRESIERLGLLHAPIVRFRDGQVHLVAGERRLRAIVDLYELGGTFSYNGEPVPHGQVPVTTLGELSRLDAWEAELEENIRRQDLTWQERAQAESALMDLRSQQAVARGAAPPSVAELTREIHSVPEEREKLGDLATATRNNLIIARHLADPEVAAAPTAKEAFKILKKREVAQQNAALAETVGQTFSTAAHTLLNEDSLAWMASAPPGAFDVILTDPPYGMGAHEFGDSGQGTAAAAHFYDDSYENWKRIVAGFAAHSFLLAAPEAHLYAFCDFDRFHELKAMLELAGWKVHRTPLIWHNSDGFRAPWPEQGCQRKYELILYAVKGGRRVNELKGDVLAYTKDKALGHPAQKPAPLLVDLLRRSARPGDRVLDPFAGSGSTIEACHELKLTCTAVELDPSAYGIAVKRLQGLSALDQGLF